jgi:hypothetical protein
MKGFTFWDDPPFPSFVSQGQALFFVFGRVDRHSARVLAVEAELMPAEGSFASSRI